MPPTPQGVVQQNNKDMYNVVTKKDEDPQKEFTGLWLNELTGGLWVWAKKPIRIGFAKDGHLLNVDVYVIDFVFTPAKNHQVFEYNFDYAKAPMMVLAQVETKDFEGSLAEVHFGNLYGTINAKNEEFVIVTPKDNVSLNGNLTVRCEPTKGEVKIKLFLISYE